jgi:YHS domain-containing protein
MHSLKHAITALALIAGLAVSARADEAEKPTATEPPKELKNQTHCPVMGGKIDSTVYTDIQGQRVYHCCPMCSATLKADPDKYFKKAAEEGVLFENIQTTCPVSGEKLKDKSVYTDYDGRRIAFCCKKCLGTFNEHPAKYLKNLDEGADAKTENMEIMQHSDHSEQSH